MRHADRKLAAIDRLAQGHAEVVILPQYFDLRLAVGRAAAFVLLHALEKLLEPPARVVKMRDGLYEAVGVEVHELPQKAPEGAAADAQHLGIPLRRLKGHGGLDEIIEPPELNVLVLKVDALRINGDAVAQHDVVAPLGRVVEVQAAATLHGLLLGHDVLRDEVDVVHHADRLAEDIGVDLLHEVLLDLPPVVERDVVGGVDMSGRDPAGQKDLAGDAKLLAEIGELVLYGVRHGLSTLFSVSLFEAHLL